MGRSVKKGPYVEESLMVKIRALNERNEKKVFKDLVAAQHHHARFRGPHARGA